MHNNVTLRLKGFVFILFFSLTILKTYSQVNFSSSNLPIVVINTNGRTIVDEPKVTVDMKILFKGDGQVNQLTDPASFEGKIAIEYRGASSQFYYPKKSYGFETVDSLGEDLKTSLLGMPAESDWVLYAPYGDKSLMRDVLTYYMGNKLGHYASRTKFCELILNGEYRGIYVLMEKIKRDKNRVGVAKLNPEEISGDDLTGGYIIKIDKNVGSNSGEGWTSPVQPYNTPSYRRVFFQYHYPDQKAIVAEQKTYIKGFMDAFDAALKSSTYTDPASGYAKYIDVSSFVDYMIITEATKNIDGYRLSSFFYKDKDSDGGKLFAGPLWDYNLAYGNANYCDGWKTTGWGYKFNSVCPNDGSSVPFYWERLKSDTAFNNQVYRRYTELRQSVLKTENLHNYLDSTATALQQAQQRNYQKWPILGAYVWPNYYIGRTYEEEVGILKNWVAERMAWLDQNITKSNGSGGNAGTDLINAFPNPFTSTVTITFADGASDVTASIYNASGTKVADLSKRSSANNTSEWRWRPFNIQPGTYVCVISKGGNRIASTNIFKQ